MGSMPRRLILLLAGSLLLLAPLLTIQLATGAGRAHACSCHPNPPPLEALNGSAAVFSGKVVSSGTFSFEHYWSVEIEVDTVWKGPVTSTTFVYTTYGPTCGYEWFERGKDFLVYAYEGYESDETLYASLCSRTRPFEYAEEDLQELGDGWAPDTGVTGALPASTPWWWPPTLEPRTLNRHPPRRGEPSTPEPRTLGQHSSIRSRPPTPARPTPHWIPATRSARSPGGRHFWLG